MTTVSVDFWVVTAVGKVVYTSPDEDIARKWLFARRPMFRDAVVGRSTRTETFEVTYKPRPLEIVK